MSILTNTSFTDTLRIGESLGNNAERSARIMLNKIAWLPLDAKLTGRQHVKLKDDRRAVTKALKGKIPAIPAKSGILDLGYTGRLEEHIKAQEKIIRNLMSERHRVEKAERELSRAIQMLPEADAQAERIKVLERSLRDAQEGTRRIQEQLSKIAPNPMAVDANYASRRALEQGSAALPKDDQAHKL